MAVAGVVSEHAVLEGSEAFRGEQVGTVAEDPLDQKDLRFLAGLDEALLVLPRRVVGDDPRWDWFRAVLGEQVGGGLEVDVALVVPGRTARANRALKCVAGQEGLVLVQDFLLLETDGQLCQMPAVSKRSARQGRPPKENAGVSMIVIGVITSFDSVLQLRLR